MKFISFPNDGLAEYGTDESQDADVIYTLPGGNGATGERLVELMILRVVIRLIGLIGIPRKRIPKRSIKRGFHFILMSMILGISLQIGSNLIRRGACEYLGTKNMIRVADSSHKNPDGSLKNTDKDKTMFLGAQARYVLLKSKSRIKMEINPTRLVIIQRGLSCWIIRILLRN